MDTRQTLLNSIVWVASTADRLAGLVPGYKNTKGMVLDTLLGPEEPIEAPRTTFKN